MAEVRNVLQHWYLCPVGDWVNGPYQSAREAVTCPRHGRKAEHHLAWADPADQWTSRRLGR